jgi:hypothetical protein
VTLDDSGHCRRDLRIGEVCDDIHPTIGEIVPDSVQKVNEAAGLRKESRHAGTTKVVPLLGGGGMDRAELVWGRDVVGGARIEADPTRSWLAASPGRPVIPREGYNVAHDGLIVPITGDDRVGDKWRRRRGDGSEVEVGDAISERMEEELGKVLKREEVQST